MTFAVRKLSGPTLDAIEIPGIGLLTKEEALRLAVQIVHVADGNMVRCMSTTYGVEAWNEQSAFHVVYRNFMENRWGCTPQEDHA